MKTTKPDEQFLQACEGIGDMVGKAASHVGNLVRAAGNLTLKERALTGRGVDDESNTYDTDQDGDEQPLRVLNAPAAMDTLRNNRIGVDYVDDQTVQVDPEDVDNARTVLSAAGWLGESKRADYKGLIGTMASRDKKPFHKTDEAQGWTPDLCRIPVGQLSRAQYNRFMAATSRGEPLCHRSEDGESIELNPAHKGDLHAALDVPKGQPIPVAKLRSAAKSTDPHVRKMADFALNARNWHHESRTDEAAAAPGVDDIMRYEDGDMDQAETITFFQALIDSGMAWTLQGSYGRTAQALIDAGLCHR